MVLKMDIGNQATMEHDAATASERCRGPGILTCRRGAELAYLDTCFSRP
jgi:hypothetical protein